MSEPEQAPTGKNPGSKIWIIATGFLTICCLCLGSLTTWLWLQSSKNPQESKATISAPPPAGTTTDTSTEPDFKKIRDSRNQTPVRASSQKRPASKQKRPEGNRFSAKLGAKASGCDGAKLLINDSLNYDGNSGFAQHSVKDKKKFMQIELPKAERINRIKFLLYARDNRAYYYTLSVSMDGKDWKMVKDARKTKSRAWQDIRFEAGMIKFVRLQGTGGTANPILHVIELQGFSEAKERKPYLPRVSSARGLKPGIWTEYYDGISRYPSVEDSPTLSKAEPKLYFPTSSHPRPGWPLGDACGAIFSGYLKIEKAGTYIFFSNSDDGSMLYINDELVVDNDGGHGMEEKWGDIDLKPGYHPIYLKYFNAGGGRGLQVEWQPKGDDRSVLDETLLFHRPGKTRANLAEAR